MEEGVVEYKNSIKNIALEQKIIKAIAEQLKRDFPSVEVIKFNIDIINDICNAIEEMVDEHKLSKVNKLDLFLKIYSSVFGNLSEQDKKIIVMIVEYLHTNGLIKIKPFLSKIWKRYIKPFFSKKG